MNQLSMVLSPSPFFNLMIIAHLFLNAFLIFVVWRLKEKVTEPEEPSIDDIFSGHIRAHEEVEKLGQSEAKVGPISREFTETVAYKDLQARLKASPKYTHPPQYEGDMAEEKGGYVDPVIKDGSKGKEYEAYVPGNDPKRKMEGKEDNNFI